MPILYEQCPFYMGIKFIRRWLEKLVPAEPYMDAFTFLYEHINHLSGRRPVPSLVDEVAKRLPQDPDKWGSAPDEESWEDGWERLEIFTEYMADVYEKYGYVFSDRLSKTAPKEMIQDLERIYRLLRALDAWHELKMRAELILWTERNEKERGE